MKRKAYNIAVIVMGILTVIIIIWGINLKQSTDTNSYSDGIELEDLNHIYLEGSKVHVDFSEVIIGKHEETRKLIVSTQEAKVSTELTDKMIEALNFDFLQKTQSVEYTGTGRFVVDLDNLTKNSVITDNDKKTVTIKIEHAYLETIEIDPYKVKVGDVKEGFFARGDITMSIAEYNKIEKVLNKKLTDKFNTADNGQKADEIALKMVKEIYEPIIKAIDHKYEVVVEFR